MLQRAFLLRKTISNCQLYIMKCYDIIQANCSRVKEGNKWLCSIYPGSSLPVLAYATDPLGRFPKVQLIILGITVFSFLRVKPWWLRDYYNSRAGREIWSTDHEALWKPWMHNAFHLDISHPLQIHLPSILGQRNEDTILLHESK